MKFFTDENIKERNNIAKRLIFLFAVFICLFSAAILSLFLASQNADAQNVVDQQSSYLLSVYKSRGTIYDKDLEPITNAHEKYAYAVAPCANSMYEISNIYGDKYLPQLKNAAPFLFFDDKLSLFSNDYIDTFVVNERYSDVAPHVVGYLDFNKTGVYGIERAFEGILSRFKGEAKIKYTVNAKNTAIAIDEREITDTLSASKGGVVLTIEKELQLFCQKAAEKYIKTGAIVVSEVNTGKLRAVVSVPGYSQNALENSLQNKNFPFINRAFSAYTPGSIFKIVSAAAALKSGIDTKELYECKAAENGFFCYNRVAHGADIDFAKAISVSCNSYFVNASRNIEAELFYNTAKDFGLASNTVFYKNYESESGQLPSIFKLTNDNIRAQFSFGQGETTVTPLQVSQIVAAIVNGGYFTPLKLIEGVVNEEKKYIEKYKDSKKKKILDKEHADIIKSAMFLAAKEGTAYIPQKSETTNFGAKTGTAQTGKFSRDNEIVNFWYVGFYPYYNPKYTVVILCDNICEAEGSPCDEVFSKVIDFLKEYN